MVMILSSYYSSSFSLVYIHLCCHANAVRSISLLFASWLLCFCSIALVFNDYWIKLISLGVLFSLKCDENTNKKNIRLPLNFFIPLLFHAPELRRKHCLNFLRRTKMLYHKKAPFLFLSFNVKIKTLRYR